MSFWEVLCLRKKLVKHIWSHLTKIFINIEQDIQLVWFQSIYHSDSRMVTQGMKVDCGQNVPLVVSLWRFVVSLWCFHSSAGLFDSSFYEFDSSLTTSVRRRLSFRRFDVSFRRFIVSMRRFVVSTRPLSEAIIRLTLHEQLLNSMHSYMKYLSLIFSLQHRIEN